MDFQVKGDCPDESDTVYRLRYRLDVPPLLFDAQELEALLIGSRMVQAWGDAELAAAAGAALAKIHNALPEQLRRESRIARLYVPPKPERPAWLQELRSAIRHRNVVSMDYRREDGTPSQREVWPLGLFFWGSAWTLVGWCTMRNDFRHFRVDRIQQLQCVDAVHPVAPGQRLDDYFDCLERQENITIHRD